MNPDPEPASGNVTGPAKPSLEHRLRELYGWIFVKSLYWIHAAPVEKQLARARLAARLLWLPDRALYKRNGPLVLGHEAARKLHDSRFEYWARWFLDTARLRKTDLAGILARVQISGAEHLEAARAGNKGVLLVSAHAGSWWDVPLAAAALGHPVSSVLAPTMQGKIIGYLREIASRLNCLLTFVRMGAYEAGRAAFKKGEVFYLAFDYAARGDRSIAVPFGERAELRLDTGPGVMAIRHQVPIVWVDTHHDELGRSCLHFHPPIRVGKGSEHPTRESVLQYFVERLNDQVARHPEQWWLLGFDYLHERPTPPNSDSN